MNFIFKGIVFIFYLFFSELAAFAEEIPAYSGKKDFLVQNSALREKKENIFFALTEGAEIVGVHISIAKFLTNRFIAYDLDTPHGPINIASCWYYLKNPMLVDDFTKIIRDSIQGAISVDNMARDDFYVKYIYVYLKHGDMLQIIIPKEPDEQGRKYVYLEGKKLFNLKHDLNKLVDEFIAGHGSSSSCTKNIRHDLNLK